MTNTGSVKIFAVDEVHVHITRTRPPWLVVHAAGRVGTTGWTGGELSAHVHATPPPDGVQGFDFVAKPPTPNSIVLNVLTTISAHAELTDVDVANYWGPDLPLKGVRVEATSNAKTVDVRSREEARRLGEAMSPLAVATFAAPSGLDAVPGFEEEIKPLFRQRDVIVMQSIRGFNLHNYEDVKANARRIFEKLNDDMPCDGLWPQEDIAKFEAWMNGGMPA